jgi:hypothetical protein
LDFTGGAVKSIKKEKLKMKKGRRSRRIVWMIDAQSSVLWRSRPGCGFGRSHGACFQNQTGFRPKSRQSNHFNSI